jgi:hypothetical protein
LFDPSSAGMYAGTNGCVPCRHGRFGHLRFRKSEKITVRFPAYRQKTWPNLPCLKAWQAWCLANQTLPKEDAMIKKATLAMTAIAVLSISMAGSALARDRNYIATEQYGFGNVIDFDSQGRGNYASAQQNGSRNVTNGRIRGGYNAQAVGQYGNGNAVGSSVRGSDNDLGILQHANGARVKARIHGNDNGAAIYQYRNGSRADVRIHGSGNETVIRQ